MNSLKSIGLWIVAVGTVLILGDDLLALYKVIEFRGAVHKESEFALIIGLFIAVGLSAALLLFPLLLFVSSSARAAPISRPLCMLAAACAAGVLLLNGVHLTEWSTRALEGRNYSAAWCLIVSLLCLVSTRHAPE